MKMKGVLRSSHALLGFLALAAVVLYALARDTSTFVALGAFGLFALCTLAVVGRYALKGPEQDHALPEVEYRQDGLYVSNADPVFVQRLVELAVSNRRELPPPAGLIKGSAADRNSIHLISDTEAAAIAKADASTAILGRGGSD